MKTNRIKYAVIILIIIPLALILWDAYGRFFSHQQKKYAKTVGGFRNRLWGYKQGAVEEYLAIWKQWNQMQDDPVVNISGEWLFMGGGEAHIELIIQQEGSKIKGHVTIGRFASYTLPLEGRVSGNKFTARYVKELEVMSLAASIKMNRMEGYSVYERFDYIPAQIAMKWIAQKVK